MRWPICAGKGKGKGDEETAAIATLAQGSLVQHSAQKKKCTLSKGSSICARHFDFVKTALGQERELELKKNINRNAAAVSKP